MCKLLNFCLLFFISSFAFADNYRLQVENSGYEAVVEVNRKQQYHDKVSKPVISKIKLENLKDTNSISVNGHHLKPGANLTVVVYKDDKIILYRSWSGKQAVYYGSF